MYALLGHVLISIIATIASVHLFCHTWEKFIRLRREQQWIEPSFRFARTPLRFLSLAWALITCGLVLIWIMLLSHVASYVMHLPPAAHN